MDSGLWTEFLTDMRLVTTISNCKSLVQSIYWSSCYVQYSHGLNAVVQQVSVQAKIFTCTY